MTQRPPTRVQLAPTVVDGDTYRASYTVSKGVITVEVWGPDADFRSNSTQLGGSATHPEGLARILVRELVGGMREQRAKEKARRG